MTEKFSDEIPTDCPVKACRHIARSFTRHPAEVGETYLQHLWFTFRMGAQHIVTGVALVIHGFLPFLFTTYASRQCREIHAVFDARNKKRVKQ